MTKTATLEDRCRQYEDWLSRIVYADMLADVTGDEGVADTVSQVVEEAKAAGFDGFIRKAAVLLARDTLGRRYGEETADLAALLD